MADQKLTALLTSNPIDVTPDVLLYGVDDTGGTPDSGAFKAAQLMFNRYKFSVTISASDLVVALLHENGDTPSTDKPLYFKIGSTIRIVSAATSITIPDGTNYFNSGSVELGTQLVGYFVYVVWDSNSSIVALTIARIPYAGVVSDFITTTTSEKHCFNFSNFTSTDDVTNIGYFEATLSLTGTGHLWTVPTFNADNNIPRPTFRSRPLIWVSTPTGFSANPTLVVWYEVVGDWILWTLHSSGAGTSNATTTTFTLPFTAANVTGLNNWCVGRGQDNGAECSPTFRIVTNTNILDVFKGPGNTAWTASGTKFMSGQGFYRMA